MGPPNVKIFNVLYRNTKCEIRGAIFMKYSIRAEVLGLKMYQAGKPISEVKRELGLDQVIKLASNENPLGCSPKVKKVLIETVEETQLYPDASNFELKEVISKQLGVKHNEVFCGAGSDLLIRVICSTFLEIGDESIMAEITFPRYEESVKIMGGIPVIIPMKNNGLDIEQMVDSITDKTKIIWLCNPNNPTGTIFKKAELEKILPRIPEGIIIIMDEAYIEYVTDKDYPDSIELLKEYPNMIILRTFSKAYGLASLRCGYGIAHEDLVKYFNTIIGPFDVNLYAQKAAATAMRDQEFLKLVHENNIKGRDFLYKSFEKLGMPYIKTNANFIMANTNLDDKDVFTNLIKRGIIIRPGHLLGMPGWIRVSIGSMWENEKFIEVLSEIV